MNERLLVSVPEAAEMLGCSRAKLYIALAQGDLKSTRIGRLRRIEVAELRRVAVEGLPERPSAPLNRRRRTA